MGGIKPDGLDDPLAQYLPADHDPLAQFLEDKNPSVLQGLIAPEAMPAVKTKPVPSAAIDIPQQRAAATIKGSQTPEQLIQQQYAENRVKSINEAQQSARFENQGFYFANRLADIGNKAIEVALGGLQLFDEPQRGLEGVKVGYEALKRLPEQSVQRIKERGVVTAVLNDFVMGTVVKPLYEDLVKTPLDLAVVEPLYIALTGNRSYSEEEMQQMVNKSAPAVVGMIVGGGIGKAIVARQMESDIAAQVASKLSINPSKISSLDDVAATVAIMGPEVAASLRAEIPSYVKAMQYVTKVTAEGVGGGVAAGITQEGTPEEKMAAALMYSAYGPLIAAGLHGVADVSKFALKNVPGKIGATARGMFNAPTGAEIVRLAAKYNYVNEQGKLLLALPLSERNAALHDLYLNVPFNEILLRRLNRGIFDNVTPEQAKIFSGQGYTAFDNGDGTFRILVDKTVNVDPQAYQSFPEGLNQRVESATAAMDEKLLADIALNDAELFSVIQKLTETGDIESVQKILRGMDQRNQLQRAAFTNPLTGIANRRAFDLAISNAERDPNTTVFSIDLNALKLINDKVGHQAGDAMLKAFADHMKQTYIDLGLPLRDVFHHGGDEFAAIVNSVDPAIVGQVKAAIDRFEYTAGEGLTGKASSGFGNTFAQADAMMYRNKNISKGLPPEAGRPTVAGSISDAQRAFFKQTGFLVGEKIKFNGKEWFVTNVIDDNVYLASDTGDMTVVNRHAVTRLPTLEIATPKGEQIPNPVLSAPLDPAAAAESAPTEPGFKRVQDPATGLFRAELVRPAREINLNARTEPGQIPYEATPQVKYAKPAYRFGIPINFSSMFDKAVYIFARTTKQLNGMEPAKRAEAMMKMQKFAREVGVTVKSLQDHKQTLLDRLATYYKASGGKEGLAYRDELGAGMNSLDLSATTFSGERSKFRGVEYQNLGEMVDAGDINQLKLTPEELSLVEQNKAQQTKNNTMLAGLVASAIHDGGFVIDAQGSKIVVRDSKGVVKAVFNNFDDAVNFSRTAVNGSGGPDIRPDLGGIANVPPDMGNIPSQGNWDPTPTRPNLVNQAVRSVLAMMPAVTKPRYGLFRDIATTFNVPEVLRMFDGMDFARQKADAESAGFREQLKPIVQALHKINPERVNGVLQEYLNTASMEDLRSNVPGRRIRLDRATTDVEFNRGSKMASLAKSAFRSDDTSPTGPIERAFGYIKDRLQLEKKYNNKNNPDYLKKVEEQDAMLSSADKALVEFINEGHDLPQDQANMMDVTLLAETELLGKRSKFEFAATNKMTPQELSIMNQVQVYADYIAARAGFTSGSLLNHFMRHVGKYDLGTFKDGSLAFQKWSDNAEKAFLENLIRNGDNVEYDKNMVKNMLNYTDALVRKMHLNEAEKTARNLLAQSIEKVGGGGAKDAYVAAKNMKEHAEYYLDEVMQRPFGVDARVNAAAGRFVDNLLVKLGKKAPDAKPIEVNIRKGIVSWVNRVVDAAAQGGKISAGVQDFLFFVHHTFTQYQSDRWVNLMNLGAETSKRAEQLQREGKISGLQQIMIEDKPKTTNQFGEAVESLSEKGFKLSGQPWVFRNAQALIYTEAMGRAAEGFKRFGKDLGAVAEHVDLEMLSDPERKEFGRLALDGDTEAASEFYARSMIRRFANSYGRANHPEGFGSVYGRLLGTFGQWPIWATDAFLQAPANLSYRRMAGWAAKVGAIGWAYHEVQQETGWNFKRYLYNPFDWLTWQGSPLAQAAYAVTKYTNAKITGNEKLQSEAEWQLNNYIPGEDNWKSIFLPFSFTLQNSRETLEELNSGNLIQAMARQLDLRPPR